MADSVWRAFFEEWEIMAVVRAPAA